MLPSAVQRPGSFAFNRAGSTRQRTCQTLWASLDGVPERFSSFELRCSVHRV